jgi:hypothetical protein
MSSYVLWLYPFNALFASEDMPDPPPPPPPPPPVRVSDINAAVADALTLADMVMQCGKSKDAVQALLLRITGRQELHMPLSRNASALTRAGHEPTAALMTDLFNRSSLPLRMALSQRLLDQRQTVPLLTRRDDNTVVSHTQALRRVQAKLTAGSRVAPLHDEGLQRVLMITDLPPARRQTSALAKALFNVKLLSRDVGATPATWLVELGVGFIEIPTDDTSFYGARPGAKRLQSVLLVVVSGDAEPVMPLVKSWADVVMVEATADGEVPAIGNLQLLARLMRDWPQGSPSPKFYPWAFTSKQETWS